METETTYRFDELSDSAKNYVREWFDVDVDLDYMVDDFKESMLSLGVTVDDVQYSISCSQGDGASWTGTMQIIPFLERLTPAHPLFAKGVVLVELIREGWVEDVVGIVRNSYYYYSHSGTMGVDGIRDFVVEEDKVEMKGGILQGGNVFELFDSIGGEFLLNYLQEAMLEEAKMHADKLFPALQTEYEWARSDERIAECAEINDWLFDENGKLVN